MQRGSSMPIRLGARSRVLVPSGSSAPQERRGNGPSQSDRTAGEGKKAQPQAQGEIQLRAVGDDELRVDTSIRIHDVLASGELSPKRVSIYEPPIRIAKVRVVRHVERSLTNL